MNRKKALTIILLLLLTATTFAFAASDKVHQLSMMAAKEHPKAGGTLTLSADAISITAEGLKPDSVYTVWFVNMKPKMSQAGAGEMPYMFKTDSQGKGEYKSALANPPFGKWQMVMVMLHPDGKPENMKNMVKALSATVPTSN